MGRHPIAMKPQSRVIASHRPAMAPKYLVSRPFHRVIEGFHLVTEALHCTFGLVQPVSVGSNGVLGAFETTPLGFVAQSRLHTRARAWMLGVMTSRAARESLLHPTRPSHAASAV
jgi:hypothetical protein